MAWDAINTIPAMHGKSLALREIFAKAANAALDKGQSEEEAKFSGMNAVRIHEKKNPMPKAMPPKVPAHVQAVRSMQGSPFDMVSKAVEPTVPSISIKAMDFDAQGHLVVLMSDGSKIVTRGRAVEEHINQAVSVSTNPVFDYVQMNTTANLKDEDFLPGMLTWNDEEDCLDIVQADGSRLQTGLENYIIVQNNTDQAITNGTVVRFSGVGGIDSPTIVPMLSDGSVEPLAIVGVLTNTLEAGQTGRATVFGKVRNIDTTGAAVGETWSNGDLLWVHPTMAGYLTKVRPSAPDLSISVAAVVRVGVTTGAILVRPTLFPRLYYGSFSSSISQEPVAIQTPYAVTYNNIEFASGIHLSNSSKIYTEKSGLYNFDFRLQVVSSNASSKNIYIWARKNGVDIPRSTTKLSFSGNGTELAPSWSFTSRMLDGDYFELMYAVDSIAVSIHAPAATTFCPDTPSATMCVTQINL